MTSETPPGSRAATLDRYRERYESGVYERENTLALYDSYLSRIEPSFTLVKLVEAALRRRTPARILDIGCGDAGALGELRTRFGRSIRALGIDLVPPPDGRLDEFVSGDAAGAGLPAECDLILSFRALHEIGRPLEMIEQVLQSLTTGGRAILSIRTMDTNRRPLCYAGIIDGEDLKGLEALAAGANPSPEGVHVLAHRATAEGTFQQKGEQESQRTRVHFLAGVDVLIERPHSVPS
jgi:SAM-dependent methyltransferase